MAHDIVKIKSTDDGLAIKHAKWCLAIQSAGTQMALCTGDVFGHGESSVVYQSKTVEKGGVTCPECLAQIKWFKSLNIKI